MLRKLLYLLFDCDCVPDPVNAQFDRCLRCGKRTRAV
jgi:hypothetical protein